jgi:hypothetical protein
MLICRITIRWSRQSPFQKYFDPLALKHKIFLPFRSQLNSVFLKKVSEHNIAY